MHYHSEQLHLALDLLTVSNNAVSGDAAANAKQIFDFIKSKSLNDIQQLLCGIIEAESGYNPPSVNSGSGAKVFANGTKIVLLN